MKSEIVKLADKHFRSALRLRRVLHQYPEVAFEEKKTASTLKEFLRPLGLKISRNIARTGFTALLTGDRSGSVAALRSDMDALAVEEMTGLPYRSKVKGRMHACGHDVHMSIAAGTAAILSDMRDSLKGSVKFIFQPAEEAPPGGASLMIEQGVLTLPDVDAIFGFHVDPEFRTGRIAVRDGVMMAGVDDFDLEIIGESGHAAKPHQSVDAIVVAANVVAQLQDVVSRRIDPLEPVVLTFGTIGGGATRNVVADRVLLEGTIRSLSRKTAARMRKLVEQTCRHVTRAAGATHRLRFITGYPPLTNSARINRYVRAAASEMYGRKCVVEIDRPIMAAEDFAQYLEHVPGAMFRIGVRNRQIGAIYPWHHGRFMVDEEAIRIGMAVCARALIDFLDE